MLLKFEIPFCKLSTLYIMKKAFLFILSLAAFACAMSASEALNKSKEWFGTSKSWSFDFKMMTYLADSPSTGYQEGSILVSDGNKFKLTIPGMTFISDGQSYWQWNVDQKQVLIKAVEDLESTMHPSELLFKYLKCKALSMKEDIWKGNKVYALKLSPKEYGGQFTEMEVWLSQKDFSPVRLFTVDDMGNSTWYDVSNLKVRRDLKTEDFKYKSVKGVDELDMR